MFSIAGRFFERASNSAKSRRAASPIVSTALSVSLLMQPIKHGANRSMSRDFQKQERELSTVENASAYVKRMVESETRGWGDQSNAQQRLEARYGLPFWALEHLRTGRAKTIEAGLFTRIRAAYLDLCERQVTKLQHEIAIEKAIQGDDSVEDLVREAAALAARIAAKRSAMR